MIRFCAIASYCASLVLFGIAARVSVQGAATMLVSFAILSFAGVVFLRQLVPTIESRLCILTFGPVIGLVFGRFCLVLTGLAFGPSLLSAAVAHGVIACTSLLLAAFRPRPLPPWTPEDRRELDWILGMSSAVLLAMAISYWGVGRLTEKGYAFVPNFGWDLFNHIACGAELARRFPPENPYFAGQRLHYYWFYHLWPAALINLSGVTARDAVVLTLPPTALLFAGALTCLVRSYVPKTVPRFLAIGLGLFAYSYIGIFYIIRTLAPHLFASIFRLVNTNYSFFSFLSHSWFRDFLYEPHAVTSLTCLAFLVYLDKIPKTGARLRSALLAGLVLGVIVITDLFVGMIGLLWFAATNLRRFVGNNENRPPILLESLVALVVILGAFALQLFPAPSGALRPGIHPMAKYAPIYLLVELGPIFVFGVVGLYLTLRRGRIASSFSLLILLAIALVIAFTLTVDLNVNQVIRKSIKVVQIPLVVFSAVAFDAFLDLPSRHWIRLTGVLAILAGFLTIVTDIFQYVDVEAKKRPPPDGICQPR